MSQHYDLLVIGTSLTEATAFCVARPELSRGKRVRIAALWSDTSLVTADQTIHTTDALYEQHLEGDS